MRTIATALLLLLCATSAGAASPLQGQWRVDIDADPEYVGIVLIDAEGRALWDSPRDAGRPAYFRGVARIQPIIEIVFTNGVDVVHTYCTVQSIDLLACHNVRTKGSSAPFMMRRIGPGPANLLD